jgi:hypothetical protein
MFLRLQLTPHTVTLSLLSYMFEDPKFLRPQLEPRARHIKLISTTEAVPYACVIQWNILNGHLFLPPQFVPNKTHCNMSVEIGLRLDSPKRRDSHSVLYVRKYPLSCKQKKYILLDTINMFSSPRNSPHFVEPKGSLPRSQQPNFKLIGHGEFQTAK